jgi:hypothetical protein
VHNLRSDTCGSVACVALTVWSAVQHTSTYAPRRAHVFLQEGYQGITVVRHLIETLDNIPEELTTDPGESLPKNIYNVGLWREVRCAVPRMLCYWCCVRAVKAQRVVELCRTAYDARSGPH